MVVRDPHTEASKTYLPSRSSGLPYHFRVSDSSSSQVLIEPHRPSCTRFIQTEPLSSFCIELRNRRHQSHTYSLPSYSTSQCNSRHSHGCTPQVPHERVAGLPPSPEPTSKLQGRSRQSCGANQSTRPSANYPVYPTNTAPLLECTSRTSASQTTRPSTKEWRRTFPDRKLNELHQCPSAIRKYQ